VKPNVHVVSPAVVTHEGAALDEPADIPATTAATTSNPTKCNLIRLCSLTGLSLLSPWGGQPTADKCPGGSFRVVRPHRPGSVELLTVQSGTVTLDVGDHHVEMPAGDSAWFDATWPHVYANAGSTVATFTLVVVDPA
jgi:mannose-6-phosphate isomerase-like protein (cupin superfamily)